MMMDPDTIEAAPDDVDTLASTDTSARISAHPRRIEVITRSARRRRWSLEQKQQIVAESVAGTVPLTAIARKHGIGTGMLYAWRRKLLTRLPVTTARFARVEMSEQSPPRMEPIIESVHPGGLIEIVLPGAVSVRVDARVDVRATPRIDGSAWMIAPPPGIRVWLACGRTDMRKGMDGLAMLARHVLNENPFGDALFAFRGRRGSLVKLLWFDGQGLCLFSKRLERGHFVWPVTDTGRVSLTPAQLSMLLEGIDWRMPKRVRHPARAG